MMGYKLTIETSAEKEISKLQPEIRQRIVEKVGELTNSPRPSGCRKLRVMDGYRIRIGDYRVLYTVDDAREVVTIFRVMKRDKAYS